MQTQPKCATTKTGQSFRHNQASGSEDYQNLDADGRYCYTVFQSKLADFRRKNRLVAETVTLITSKFSLNALFVTSFSKT